jgi:hypothetical protein
MVVLPMAPMPRMFTRMKDDWTLLVAWKLDATLPS